MDDFLAAGAPPVFFGMGSMLPRADLPAMFVDAARRVGVRAIVAGEGPSAADVCFAPGVLPHARLFPRCAAIVHHGGAGTTIAAVRAARPQVVVPVVADQHVHGRIVARHGLGPAPVPHARVTTERLAGALREALARSDAAVLRDRADAVPLDGVEVAAAAIEAMAAA